jgi:membrane protein DedA with SNARE-associated domain
VIDPLLEHGTYVGLLLALVLGGLGVPIPEELPVLTAGVLAHEQVVTWWVALPVCLVGVLAGDLVLYWIGHRWGETVLTWRHVRWFLTPERERALIARYHRHGAKIIVAGRHFMGLRAAIFLTAGIVRLPFWRFLVADAATVTVGGSFTFFVAYAFTDHLTAILAGVYRAERWLALIGLVVAVVAAVALHQRQRRLVDTRAAREADSPDA